MALCLFSATPPPCDFEVTTAPLTALLELVEDEPIEVLPLVVERVSEDIVFLESEAPLPDEDLFLPDPLPIPLVRDAGLSHWSGPNVRLQVRGLAAARAATSEPPSAVPQPELRTASSNEPSTAGRPTGPPAAPIRRAAVPRPGNERPPYPSIARRHGWEGIVELELRIDSRGRVHAASVVASSGYAALDDAACDAVLAWRFDPEQRSGVAVEARVRTRVRFVLT